METRLSIRISTFTCFVFLSLVSSAVLSEQVIINDEKSKLSFSDEIEKIKKSSELSPQVLKEVARLEKKYPQKDVGAPKYQRSGHQYTTYIIAYLSGLGKEKSHKLAYYSQFPDDEVRFSATLAAIYLFDLQYREQIMAVLHSLHGGDQNAVIKRRKDLKQLIANGIKDNSLKEYEIGLMTHAFADSYSHVKLEQGELEAFDYVWGHLFHGHEPDIIAYEPERYKDYACNLYQALSGKNSCEIKLQKLFSMIDKLAVTRDEELPEFEKYAEELLFSSHNYQRWGEQWAKSVGKTEVVNTIKKIESAI